MTTMTTDRALSATESAAPAGPTPMYPPETAAVTGPLSVPAVGTAAPSRRRAERVPCTECGTEHPPNKSGLCRTCFFASDWPRRNAMSRHGQGAKRKTEPEEQAAMLARMIESATRRWAAEDPGCGLAAALAVQERLDRAVDAIGFSLAEQVGTSQIADDLGWRRQRADKRWGPDARARKGW